MDIAVGPVALAGIMICTALAGWTLGRWQGGLISAVADRSPAPVFAAAIAPLRRARTVDQPQPWPDASGTGGRSAELATASSLAQMHEEIIAYRRAQQVLTDLSGDALHLIANQAEVRSECDGLGACGCEAECPSTAQAAACRMPDQAPAFVPSGLTRV